jgi:hypothetical protein
MMFDEACVPNEDSRSRLPKLDVVRKRCTDCWFAIIALSSPVDHDGENDELPVAWDCVEAVRFRLRTAFGACGTTIWGRSLSFATCKGGSLVDPRLSCDMCEKALSLRLTGTSVELLRLGNATTSASLLLVEGNVTLSRSPFFSPGLGWKSSL